MKKRLFTLLMTFILCISFLPVYPVFAADEDNILNTVLDNADLNYNDWTLGDMLVGESYGICPMSWYERDMTETISEGELWILLARIRCKLLESDCVTDNPDILYATKKNMSVEEVLTLYYSLLTNMKFTSDLGFQSTSAVENMKAAGVYKGTDGEPELSKLCAIEDACVYATRIITYVYDKLNAGSKGLFWQAKYGNNTVYMLGSIHLASTSIYPLNQDIINAYQSSDALVVELDVLDIEGVVAAAMLGMYSDGSTLKDHVSEETYQKVVTLAENYGYSEDVISVFKPWLIDSMFTSLSYTESGNEEEATLATALGIDMNFTINAYLYGKTILEIEGYEYQAEVFNSFSDELSEYMLNKTIDSLYNARNGNDNENSVYLNYALDLWHDGNSEALKEFSSFDEDAMTASNLSPEEKVLYEEYQAKILTQRDLGMANYIEGLLKSERGGTYFVVVGSAHYASDYSVLDILKERGYTITQIK